MGQMDVARNAGVLRTLLGSCLGLALFDDRYKVAGLAHIVLPASGRSASLPGKFVDTAIPTLIQEMQRLTDKPVSPIAKIAGGANMFSAPGDQSIGVRNIEATERILGQLRIPIVARHCGGEQGRRMSLDAHTGRVFVEIIGCDTIEL